MLFAYVSTPDPTLAVVGLVGVGVIVAISVMAALSQARVQRLCPRLAELDTVQYETYRVHFCARYVTYARAAQQKIYDQAVEFQSKAWQSYRAKDFVQADAYAQEGLALISQFKEAMRVDE
jgi:hypothetical protein